MLPLSIRRGRPGAGARTIELDDSAITTRSASTAPAAASERNLTIICSGRDSESLHELMTSVKSSAASAVIRKAFVEYVLILSEWEITHHTSERLFHSLVNASQRRLDFAEADGNLGVLSQFAGAEKIIQEGFRNIYFHIFFGRN
jgi:hypothetical protein